MTPGPSVSIPALAALSERELQVLTLIGEGLSTAEIARRLGRRQETIRSHRRTLGKKLGISNRVELARFAIRAGLCSVRSQLWCAGPDNPGERLWLLAAAAQSTGVPLAIVSTDGAVRFANEAFGRLFGTEERLLGHPVHTIFVGDPAATGAIVEQALNGGSQSVEAQMCRADGSTITAAVHAAPLTDDCGQKIGFTIAVTDVSERHRSTQQLVAATQSLEAVVRERTAELQNVVELLRREIEIRKRIEARMQAVLEGVAAATGSSFFQLLVRHLAAVFGVKYVAVVEQIPGQEQRARTVAFWNGDRLGHDLEFDLAGSLCEMVLEGKPSFYPSGIRALFGPDHVLGRLPVDSYLGVPLVDSEGRRMGVLATMDDRPMPDAMEHIAILRAFAARAAGELERRRTEDARLESESRYRILADLSPVGVFVTNPELLCTYVNARWREITGLHDLELPSEVCSRVLHPEDRDRVMASLRAAAQTSAPIESEHRLVRPDGGTVRVYMQARPHLDAQQRLLGYIGALTDVTNRKHTDIDR